MLLLGTMFRKGLNSYPSSSSVLDLASLLKLGGNNLINSLVLVEGQNVTEETLRGLSLGNAKQLVVGRAPEFGMILHIAAESLDFFDKALREVARVPGVTGILTLALRTTQ
jgi:hypothetical protein